MIQSVILTPHQQPLQIQFPPLHCKTKQRNTDFYQPSKTSVQCAQVTFTTIFMLCSLAKGLQPSENTGTKCPINVHWPSIDISVASMVHLPPHIPDNLHLSRILAVNLFKLFSLPAREFTQFLYALFFLLVSLFIQRGKLQHLFKMERGCYSRGL